MRDVRSGILRLEMLAAAATMTVAMTCFVKVAFQNNLLWKDIGQHRTAVNELANQLDELTRLSVDEARQAIEQLKVSHYCQPQLVDPQLTGELERDQAGYRLDLTIRWKGPRGIVHTKQLSGWIAAEEAGETP